MHLAEVSYWVVAGVMTVVVLSWPVLFVAGAWFVDRHMRRRHASASTRWFAFAGFGSAVLLFFFILLQVPPQWQFTSHSSTLVTISYGFGLGWICTPFFAVPCIFVGLCTGVITLLLHRRHAIAPKT